MLRKVQGAKNFGKKVAIAVCCLLTSVAQPANATVLEYDKDGNITVTETEKYIPVRKSQETSSSRSDLRNLARDIAVKYSGAPGVRKAGLDAFTFVEVFEALIQQESAFNPLAVSPKGAQGLGQLMPGTAKDLGVGDPFNPESNLIGSVKYLTSLMAEFGSVKLALAAYNAGPERVRKYNGVPPFAETKNYIARIFQVTGLRDEQLKPVEAVLSSKPINKEKPLKGDVSVWEF
jgi:hypothetical protein